MSAEAKNETAAGLRIGGFLPFTAVDYPGALAAVVFCQGCPLCCVYCHNRGLLPVRGESEIEWAGVHSYLARRAGLLDAVVFSGGEPLMQSALAPAMRAVKALGFKVGLHTSGIAPARFAAIVDLLDWVGFDVKTSFDAYKDITGVAGSGEKARQSLMLLAQAGIDTEIRTTIWPGAADAERVRRFADGLADMGFARFVVQEARDLDDKTPIGGDIFSDSALQDDLARKFPDFAIRRAH